MTKNRLALVAVVLLLAIAVIFGVMAMMPPRPGAKANFGRVDNGGMDGPIAVALTDFTAPDGSCKAQFPGIPKASVRDVGGQKMYAFMVEERKCAYMLSYADGADKDLQDSAIQEAFGGAQDSMLKSLGATLVKESKITIGAKKYPGREFVGELPNNRDLMRVKIYAVDGRFYQMQVIGMRSFAESETAARFLESLTLLK